MTIDANQPVDQALNALWPAYIRENRDEINALWAAVGGGGIVVPDYAAVNMAAGQTSLAVDVDLSVGGVEIVGLTADVAVNLPVITGGTAGQLKYIIALDNDVTLIQDTGTAGGTIYMNAPVGVNLNINLRDVLALVNISGDGDTVDGYWLEMYRKLQV